jgi:hypothetical protein
MSVQRFRTTTIAAAAVAATAVATLALAEGAARLYQRFFDAAVVREAKAAAKFPTDRALYKGSIPFMFRPGAEGVYRGVPIRINQAGFRGREIGPKPAGTERVGVIGDSIVFGHGIPTEDLLSTRLEAGLRARRGSDAVEVLNFGIPGATSFEELLVVQKALTFDLDTVIWVYYFNDPDFKRWNRSVNECGLPVPLTYRVTRKLRRHSTLVDLVLQRSDHLAAYYRFGFAHHFFGLHEDDFIGYRCVRKSLTEAAALLRRAGVRPVLAIYPAPMVLGPDYPFGPLHDKARGMAAAAGFEVIDLLPAFAGVTSAQVMMDELDPHPNGFANGIAAEAIAGYIDGTKSEPAGAT